MMVVNEAEDPTIPGIWLLDVQCTQGLTSVPSLPEVLLKDSTSGMNPGAVADQQVASHV